jgi:DNA-binding response OmpR family regulator
MQRTLRILVVDDDHDHADSLAELFRMEGHEVTVAYDAEGAIAKHLSGDFEVAFMDVVMPGMNGVESFLEIRRHRPDANIFMMSGYSVEQLLRQAVDNGALGVLSKPLDPSAVIAALDAIEPEGIVLVSGETKGLRDEICDGIRSSGKDCQVVSSELQAVKPAIEGSSDVLVVDDDVSLIEGIEVYCAMRKQGRAVPTVMLTPEGSDGEGPGGLSAGFTRTGILTKPFDVSAVLDELDEIKKQRDPSEVAEIKSSRRDER